MVYALLAFALLAVGWSLGAPTFLPVVASERDGFVDIYLSEPGAEATVRYFDVGVPAWRDQARAIEFWSLCATERERIQATGAYTILIEVDWSTSAVEEGEPSAHMAESRPWLVVLGDDARLDEEYIVVTHYAEPIDFQLASVATEHHRYQVISGYSPLEWLSISSFAETAPVETFGDHVFVSAPTLGANYFGLPAIEALERGDLYPSVRVVEEWHGPSEQESVIRTGVRLKRNFILEAAEPSRSLLDDRDLGWHSFDPIFEPRAVVRDLNGEREGSLRTLLAGALLGIAASLLVATVDRAIEVSRSLRRLRVRASERAGRMGP